MIDIEKNPEARAFRTEVSPALKPGGFLFRDILPV